MTESLNNIRNGYLQAGQVQTRPIGNDKPAKASQLGGKSFAQVLNESIAVENRAEGLRFSKHASERLSSRNIDLSAGQLKRLETGVSKAHTKGINESLVMVDDVAFIVNIKNNMVITAVSDMDEQVFTNIDGAVIA